MNEDQVSFGLRIRLDGEQVYYNRSTTQSYHVVELERPYAPGSHEIQFEILQAARRRSTYRAHLTVQVRPTGPSVFAQGVPTSLAIGERLTLNVVI